MVYSLLIITFLVGWSRIAIFETKSNPSSSKLFVSVVVACRNEEKNLPILVKVLKAQQYKNFELILVNDHSTDATRIIMDQIDFPRLKVFDASGFGKKNALKEGIALASAELIVTTDADCLPEPGWLDTICRFQETVNAELIICPVRMAWRNGFERLQSLEFASLVASGAGASGAGMPILCNGANLAFKKQSWMQSQADLCEDELSGDDIFLLQSIKKQGGKIQFLKSESAFVVTSAAPTLNVFFKQRKRWAGKSPSYTDWSLIFTATLIFTVALWMLILLVLAVIYNPDYVTLFAVFFTTKMVLDMVFMNSTKSFFRINRLGFWSFILSLIYPLYIVTVSVSALFSKPKRWN